MDNLRRHGDALLGYGVAIALALAVGLGVVGLIGAPPDVAARGFASGALTSAAGLADTLNLAVPIALAGLAVVIPFRAGLLNIGGEGQLLAGALAATTAALFLPPMHALVAIPLVLMIGGLGGLAWAFVPAIGRAWLGVNEIVSTILFNFLAVFLFSLAINQPLREQAGTFPQTDRIPEHVVLPFVSSGFRAHYGVFLAVFVTAAAVYVLGRTSLGYRLTVAGSHEQLVSNFGVSRRTTHLVALLSGGSLAGLGGALQVLGVQRRLIEGFNPGFGFDGIVAAFLASGHPLGTSVAAVALGALRSGGQRLHIMTQLPISTVVLVQALLVIVALLTRRLIRRRAVPAAPLSEPMEVVRD